LMKNMLRRKYLMVLLLLCSFHASQSKTDWKAWVSYGQWLMLVDSQGVMLRDQLVPYGKRITPIVIAPTGQDAIYAIEGAPMQPASLVFYSLAANRVRRQYALTELPSSLTFNEHGTAAVMALSDSKSWRIAVIDLFTSQVVYTLGQDSNAFPGKQRTSIPPRLQQYRQGRVIFTLTTGEGYTWDTASNSLVPNPAYGNPDGDALTQTGEVVFPLHDSRFPEVNQYNTLQVYEPLRGSIHPFYSAQKQGFAQVWFIQGGQRLLVKQVDDTWLVLERDGSLVGEWPAPVGLKVEDIHNTVDGFIYTVRLKGISLPEIIQVNTRERLDAGSTVWNVPPDRLFRHFDANRAFHILWVSEANSASEFRNWAELAAPNPIPSVPTADLQPTALPSLFPALSVGMEVRVQTVGGEILNLRRGPGRTFEVIRYLKNNERLFLLEGPKQADGLLWWRISLADGLQGWAVENDGRLQTLVPF
jgi:hypothetical protein